MPLATRSRTARDMSRSATFTERRPSVSRTMIQTPVPGLSIMVWLETRSDTRRLLRHRPASLDRQDSRRRWPAVVGRPRRRTVSVSARALLVVDARLERSAGAYVPGRGLSSGTRVKATPCAADDVVKAHLELLDGRHGRDRREGKHSAQLGWAAGCADAATSPTTHPGPAADDRTADHNDPSPAPGRRSPHRMVDPGLGRHARRPPPHRPESPGLTHPTAGKSTPAEAPPMNAHRGGGLCAPTSSQ
jgi:hypothetical protein